MSTTIRRKASPRAAGPFVTASGSRLPVRVIDENHVSALLEFWDYRSRRDATVAMVGQPAIARSAIEAMAGNIESAAGPILAIMSGPAALIRGICQYGPLTNGAAEASFTIDESLDRHNATGEMLFRLADHTREAGCERFDLRAGGGSELLDALFKSGFPVEKAADTDRYVVTITEPR